jgi:hypothetical protein
MQRDVSVPPDVTKDRFLYLIDIYRNIIIEAGIQPQIVDVTAHLSREQMLGHCLWVLNEKVEPLLHRVGGFNEAIRLIGCIQGTVMACGLCTIAETREHAAAASLRTWEKIESSI